jgi:hypothetical protein
MSEEFKPTEATKAKLAAMPKPLTVASIDEFFALWETEGGDARRAGSIMAHRYLTAAAQFAVFGSACAGNEPSRELWIAACNQRFDEAVADVNAAFVEAITEETSDAHPDDA